MIRKIKRSDVGNLFTEIYEKFPDINVSLTYSEFDEKLKQNLDLRYAVDEILNEKHSTQLGIYLDSMKGYLKQRKINLNKNECNGHEYRYNLSGWGLIIMNITVKETYFEIDCNVNSEKRAWKWFDTYPDLKSPNLWDWKIVSKTYNSVNRILKKYSY